MVGLGYVGLPLAAMLACVGFQVTGVDTNENKVLELQKYGMPDFYEPGLQELLKKYKSNLEFTTENAQMMQKCQTIIITIGTQLKPDGTVDLDGLDDCRQAMAQYLSPGHLLILKSTVPCRTTRKFADQLEQQTELKAGTDFFVAYCPERTIEGNALTELRELPKIIGGYNNESAERARQVIEKLGGQIIIVSSLEVAEMCKLVDNAYRATNISFANEVGLICEAINIDSDELVSAINTGYERTSLFRSGLGAGGACLSKDPTVLALSAAEFGVDAKIIKTCIVSNQDATLRVAGMAAEFIRNECPDDSTVALLGIAFKGLPETDDRRGAPAGIIRDFLLKEFSGLSFNYYDPLIREFEGQPVSATMKGALKDANIVIFLTNHATLLGVKSADILDGDGPQPNLVIDCWHNIADAAELVNLGIKVIRIGDGSI